MAAVSAVVTIMAVAVAAITTVAVAADKFRVKNRGLS